MSLKSVWSVGGEQMTLVASVMKLEGWEGQTSQGLRTLLET